MKTISVVAALLSASVWFTPSHAQEKKTLQQRIPEVQKALAEKKGEGAEAYYSELEKQGRQLIKEFPSEAAAYDALLTVARQRRPEKGRALAEEIASNSAAPEQSRAAAKALLERFDALGKPVDLKFTAIDGSEVSIAGMKGKVVLIDFWATWCGPCVAEMPKIKEIYSKLHDKGFEIVGISFDQEKGALEKYVKENGIGWPQYFDGAGWKNKFGQKYGIQSIPTMWLVDKDSKLADMSARDNLEEKISALLAKK